ncbi:MAG: YdeI/OmpD-associated family protein [Gammaproteobacteria bacterium]
MARGRQLYFKTPEEWRRWLGAHHDSEREAWLVYYKKQSGKPRIPYDDAVDEALCFGWIDSIVRRIDDERFEQKFTPRTNTKNWSAANIERVRRLLADKRMTEAGLAKIDRSLLRRSTPKNRVVVADAAVPSYLAKALRANPRARKNFDNLAPSYRRQYIGWISAAKREATRDRRVDEVIGLLERNEKLGLK